MQNDKERRTSISILGVGVMTLLLVASVLALPRSVSADVINTFVDTPFTVFVPCANGGAGEVVLFNTTLHLVSDDGVTIHGNQSGGEGVGLTTGDVYIPTGSPSNLNPAGDGDYIYHLGWIGRGQEGAKLSITAKGPIMAPATEIIQVHCF